MDLASQTQRYTIKRAYASTMNGSMPPYHPSVGRDFSGTANRHQSFGMVVAGDASRVSSDLGPKPVVLDTGLDFSDLDGVNANMYRSLAMGAVNTSATVNLGVVVGVALVFAGLDFPLARPIYQKAKEIFQRPKPLIQAGLIATGAMLTAGSMQG